MGLRRTVGWIACLALAGCGSGHASHDRDLTERQRDSIIATEKALPGSDVVGRALATSDSATARAQRLDASAGGSDDAASGGK